MSLPFIWLLCVVKADGEFIDFQMMLMMTTIYKNSPKWPFRKPSQSTALLVVQWTNTLPWLVVYASISLEKPGTVSVVAFDFPFVFCLFFFLPGIESGSSWFQPKLFQCWVEKSGFYILRNAWPEIRNCAEKGCHSAKIQKSIKTHFRFDLFICVIVHFVCLFSRVVLVEFWHPSKLLF